MQTANQPHRINPVVAGILLMAAGFLFLLQNFAFFDAINSMVWMVLFAVAGVAFLYYFFMQRESMWWAAIPGSALLGLAVTIYVGEFGGDRYDYLAGSAFLASIGFGFALIYLALPRNWWAIIPAGVLFSLAAVAAADGLGLSDNATGSLLFLGMGLTFVVVGVLPGAEGRSRWWAFIPAAVLLLLGVLINTQFINLINYIWPAALIVGGVLVLWRALIKPPTPQA